MSARRDRAEIARMIEHRERVTARVDVAEFHAAIMRDHAYSLGRVRTPYTADTIAPTESAADYAERVNR